MIYIGQFASNYAPWKIRLGCKAAYNYNHPEKVIKDEEADPSQVKMSRKTVPG